MTEVAFYHLIARPLEAVLPRLLEKALKVGKRGVVIARSTERVEALVTALWTYDHGSWLPHGSAADGRGPDQPIWLTAGTDVPNGADFLFLVDGADCSHLADFERCFDLFDGNDADAVAAARQRWQSRRSAGYALTYWQQSNTGAWIKKA